MTAKQLINFHGHGNSITGVNYTCEKNVIASSSLDRSVKLWDLGKQKNVNTIYCKSGVKSMCQLFAEPNLITGHIDGTVRMYGIN